MSQSAATFFDSASSSAFSPTLNRQFSSSTTWPGFTSTPFSQSRINGIRALRYSDSFSATGLSESFSLKTPSFGLPRWEVTITAAPFCSAIWMLGTDARMRVSSVILPASSCGTFRSARMNTRLPRSSRSASRLNFIRYAASLRLVQGDRDVEHAVGEAPLVVVPARHLHERAARDLGQQRVDDRAGGVVVEVRGDERLGGVFEGAPQIAVGRLLERLVP